MSAFSSDLMCSSHMASAEQSWQVPPPSELAASSSRLLLIDDWDFILSPFGQQVLLCCRTAPAHVLKQVTLRQLAGTSASASAASSRRRVLAAAAACHHLMQPRAAGRCWRKRLAGR